MHRPEDLGGDVDERRRREHGELRATRGVHGLTGESDSPVTLEVRWNATVVATTLPCVGADPRGCVMVAVPDGYEDLLTRPLFGHLATTRPDGTVQVNPMWLEWTARICGSPTTTKRQKYRNVTAHPEVAMSIHDPDNPYRYLEERGVEDEIAPDPTAASSSCRSTTATADR